MQLVVARSEQNEEKGSRDERRDTARGNRRRQSERQLESILPDAR